MNRAATERPTSTAQRLLILICAVLGALALILISAGTSRAATTGSGGRIDPDADVQLVITKLRQPVTAGDAASGLPLSPDVIGTMTPVAGVDFEARKVPGIDLTTNAGQVAASKVTVANAVELTAGQPPTDAGRTNEEGVLTLGGEDGSMQVGLYLVSETTAPAGVVRSGPFLVALPLTDPAGTDSLYTVYVYPKNANVDVSISVEDESAIACGDSITWRTRTTIPQNETLSKYATENLLADGLHLTDVRGVAVAVPGNETFAVGKDYQVTTGTFSSREGFRVEFTPSGLQKLLVAAQSDPSAQVEVSYQTSVEQPGTHSNEVRLFVDEALPVTAQTTTKFGPLAIRVFEKDKPSHSISGAVFKLYLSAQSAASKQNPISVGGVGDWITKEDGLVTFGCLRFSNFVNGLDVPQGDPTYRDYFAGPVSYPQGWVGSDVPLAGSVTTTVQADSVVLDFPVDKQGPTPTPTPSPTPTPDHGLVVTGARVAGVGLLAAVALGVGATLVARSRRGAEPTDD